MKIILGSNSEQKIKYLKEVLANLKLADFDLYYENVDSGVSDQPLSQEETLEGAKNRAQAAFEKHPDAEFSIGVEVGYILNNEGNYEILCWSAIYDGTKYYHCRSNSFEMPRFHQDKLKAGQYLGNHVREYHNAEDSKQKIILGEIIVNRDTIIKNALFHVLLRYFNWGDY